MTIDPPKAKICISLLSARDHEKMGVPTQSLLETDINYHIKDFDFNNNQKSYDDIIELVKQHVLKYGEIDELVILGHGGADGYIETNGEKNQEHFEAYDFLYNLENLRQDLNTHIANKTTFISCNVFNEFDHCKIADMAYLSRVGNMEISGAVTEVELSTKRIFGVDLNRSLGGRFICFKPNNTIALDEKLDTPGVTSIQEKPAWVENILGDSSELQKQQESYDRARHIKPISFDSLKTLLGAR